MSRTATQIHPKLTVATLEYLHLLYAFGCYLPEAQVWPLRQGVEVRLEWRRLVSPGRMQCFNVQSRQANLDINIKSAQHVAARYPGMISAAIIYARDVHFTNTLALTSLTV